MKKQRNIQNVRPQLHSSFGGLKSVSVIVMLAMNPALLNSDAVAKTIQMDPENPIEVVYNLSTEAPEAPQQAQRGGYVRAKSDYIEPENVQFSMDFKAEGKNWTMYYVDRLKKNRSDKNFVSNVYFVPEDYKRVIKHIVEGSQPPKLEKVRYHDIGANEFIGVVVSEYIVYNDYITKIITREIKVPDEIGNELLGLFLGDTNFKLNPRLEKSLETVKSADLLPKVEK